MFYYEKKFLNTLQIFLESDNFFQNIWQIFFRNIRQFFWEHPKKSFIVQAPGVGGETELTHLPVQHIPVSHVIAVWALMVGNGKVSHKLMSRYGF